MIEDDRYCIDILTQIPAQGGGGAIHVPLASLGQHHYQERQPEEARAKFEELVDLFGKTIC